MKTETEKLKTGSTPKPRSYRRLWMSLAAVIGLSFLVLGYFGTEIYRKAPPIPIRVVTADGQVLFTAQQIQDGQNVWQSMGGQEVGSIWGHGAHVAPDWSADWLHREATWLLDHWAAGSGGKTYEQLPAETQAALFGVYGMLGIGLMLFCLRGLTRQERWKTRTLSFSFWSLNVGLGLMVILSLLPVGLLQTWASVEHGMWYARSAEFLQTPLMDKLRWLRVSGDTIFALGAVGIGWFVFGLKTGWSFADKSEDVKSLEAPGEKVATQQ